MGNDAWNVYFGALLFAGLLMLVVFIIKQLTDPKERRE